jgi:lysophospholipase L1-like esterase
MRINILTLVLASIAWSMGPVDQAAALDYTGDGRDDLGVYDPASGIWYLRDSTSGGLITRGYGGTDLQPVIGDFDGDGRTDVANYSNNDFAWNISQSSNNQNRRVIWGNIDSKPVPADYDGDGKTDIATYQRSSGLWRILLSSNGETRQFNFGWSEARPVQGDYDGDGRADLAVYNRASGTWYINASTAGFSVRQFGWKDARPVPADYDGDGKMDLAVFDRRGGMWYILASTSGFRQQQFGFQRTRPEPLDFDGDGRTDLAVYERNTGIWYVLASQVGFRAQSFGWRKVAALPSYANGGIEGLNILSFGDSITYGTSSACSCPLTGYPYLLEKAAGPAFGGHFYSANAGNPGEVTSDGVKRIGSWLSQVRPDLTIIMEGTNDTFFNVPFSTIENNLRRMIEQAKATGSSVILATIPPVISNQYRDRAAQMALIQQFNPRIYTIASSLGVQVAPIYEAITAVPNWQNTLMDQPTANHPNDAGYRVVRNAFLQTIEEGIINGLYW